MNAKISCLFSALLVGSASIPGMTLLALVGGGTAAEAQAQTQPALNRTGTPDLSALLAALAHMTSSEPLPGLYVGEATDPSSGIRILLVDFEQGRFDLRVEEQQVPTGDRAAGFMRKTEDVFAINGGFFERAGNDVLSPSGLLITGGNKVAEERPRAGSGVLFFDGERVGIAPRSALADRSAIREAVQVGPLLVDPGGVKGIYKDDVERHNRSAFCLRDNRLTAVVVEGGISLFQLAELLSLPAAKGGIGCEVAINLDGGPSTQAILRAGDDRREVAGRSTVQNAIVLSRRIAP